MSLYGSIFPPTAEEIIALRDVATGKAPADLAIRGGKVVFVHTGEIRKADVLIKGRRIAAVTPPNHFEAKEEFDATNHYVAPTFIESHFHIAYSLLPPGELARLVVPKGTTTILADPNCEAAVLGREGVDFISSTDTPLRIFLQVSPEIPSDTNLELGGQTLTAQDKAELLADPRAVSLGESNPFILDEDHANDLAVALSLGKRATGHTARLSGEPLWGYVAGGIGDDHNAATIDEVLELARLGLSVTIQSGSMSNYLEAILGNHSLLQHATHHISFCADDKHVIDLADEGHIDHHVREAVALGVDPALAIRMGSLNAALHYRIDHITGSITPTRYADIQLLPDLSMFKPSAVFVGGQRVAAHGKPLFENTDPRPQRLRYTIRVDQNKTAENIRVKTTQRDTAKVRAIEVYDGYYKRSFVTNLPVKNGYVQTDPERDIAKIVVADRHHNTGAAGVGFVQGFGLRQGAIATTTNCPSQNIVVIGTSDEDILKAIEHLTHIGGGYVAVSNGDVIGDVPLPILGLMTDKTWEETYKELQELHHIARDLGCPVESPFMIMSFVGLAAIPDLGLTECGLVETETQQFVDLLVDENNTPENATSSSTPGVTTSTDYENNGWRLVPARIKR